MACFLTILLISLFCVYATHAYTTLPVQQALKSHQLEGNRNFVKLWAKSSKGGAASSAQQGNSGGSKGKSASINGAKSKGSVQKSQGGAPPKNVNKGGGSKR